MNPQKNRRWLLGAMLLLVFLVGLWILSALQLQPAAASGSRISLSLRSGLAADYGAREGSLLGSLNLSIVSDFMQDLGMAPAEAEAHADEMALALASPVPSATALNFQGDPPPTLTPTPTTAFTATLPPSPTFTSTPRPLPTRTDTPEPTNTAKPAATSGPADKNSPQISGGNLSQSGGSISCGQTINVSDLRVLDPDYSSGIEYVKLKYSLDGGPYEYSALAKSSGGWTSPGSTWDALYAGSITISDPVAVLDGGRKVAARPFLISDTATPKPTHTPTATPDPTPTATPGAITYSVELHAIVADNAGKTDHVHLSDYTMTCP